MKVAPQRHQIFVYVTPGHYLQDLCYLINYTVLSLRHGLHKTMPATIHCTLYVFIVQGRGVIPKNLVKGGGVVGRKVDDVKFVSRESREWNLLTASMPNKWAWRDPYLSSCMPPAAVATFPPIKQEPLAPRSKGIMYPCSDTWLSNVSRIHPASHVRTPKNS